MNEPTTDDRRCALEVVDRFEKAWRGGRRQSIAALLGCVPDQARGFLVAQLLRVELELRRGHGESPTVDEYVTELSDWSDVVSSVFDEWSRGERTSPLDAMYTTTVAAPATDSVLPELQGVKVLGVLGRGGMGVVYKGWQEGLGRFVAIKTIVGGASSERFRREARLIAQISSPHVVAVHDLHTLPDGRLLLVMEYIEGATLADRIKAEGRPLPEPETVSWMQQVAEGMLAASERQIIHRDLKPSNILIDTRNRARVADFGLGRGPADPGLLTQSDAVLGTPYYMAPEQAEDPQSVDIRADIYSFGATFYHVLTGSPPFEGKTTFSILYKHKTEPLLAPSARNPELSDRVCEVLERCLAKSPSDRFPSFAAVRAQLHTTAQAPSPWEMPDDPAWLRYLEGYKARRRFYLSGPPESGECDRFVFPGGRTLTILRGDLVQQRVDALVSSEMYVLPMNYGVALALRKAAGNEYAREAKRFAPVRPGRVVVTSAGGLPARFVFHGVTHGLRDENWIPTSRDVIAEILASCFYHADTLGVRSIALPLLGTGGAGFSREVCLDTMFRYLTRMFLHGLTCVDDARVVIFPLKWVR
jgi:O-acetyl-ADP-ribose deacetylase (regulator of RNase III)/predicted Ser/Thr protein kinase